MRVTGYGVIFNSSGSIRYEASGIIKTTNQDTDLASRIKIILLGLEEVIEQFKPDCVSIEKIGCRDGACK